MKVALKDKEGNTKVLCLDTDLIQLTKTTITIHLPEGMITHSLDRYHTIEIKGKREST